MTPAQRELNDQKYESMKALYDAMPQEARDARFAVYEARGSVDAKADPRPLIKIRLSKWKELQLTDPGALSLYLEDKYGPGRYLIEPQDEHGQRILKFPFWCVSTNQFDGEDMDDLDDDDYDRPRRRRRRRARYDDLEEDDFDDPADRRQTIADGLLMARHVSNQGVGQAMSQSKDLVTLMMITNQENQKLAREDLVRRDEARLRDEAEARRRDQERKDVEDRRRYDDEKKREADNQKREDTIRQENQRREDAQREADRKHERDLAEARATSDRKFQALIGALPVLLPAAERMFKQAPPAARETDPLSLMIAKNFLDKQSNNDPNAAVQVIIEATKLGSQLQTEQMRSAMQMQGELSKVLLSKALEQVEGGGSKNILETITELVTGAASFAEKLIPAKPAPNPYVQQAQQVVQRTQTRPVVQQVPVQQAQATPQQQQPEQAPQHQPGQPAQLTAEQQAVAEAALEDAVRANPTYGVMRGLYALQNRFYTSQGEYQKIIEYAVQCMPLDLRVAIVDNNQERALELVLPTIQAHSEIAAWAMKPDVQGWMQSFVASLVPTIEAMHGTADQQREQYVAVLASQAAQDAGQGQSSLDTRVPSQETPVSSQDSGSAVQEGAPVGDQALSPDEQLEGTPGEQAPVTAEVIQGPGSVMASALEPETAGESSGSHLEEPDV